MPTFGLVIAKKNNPLTYNAKTQYMRKQNFLREGELSASRWNFIYIGRKFYLHPDRILELYISWKLTVYRHADYTLP